MIDWQQARTLREEIGESGFEDVLRLYLQETEATLARFGEPGENSPGLLHALRGSALTIGFTALAEMCRRLEADARRGLAVHSAPVAACYAMSRTMFLRGHGAGAQEAGSQGAGSQAADPRGADPRGAAPGYSTNWATASSAVMSR